MTDEQDEQLETAVRALVAAAGMSDAESAGWLVALAIEHLRESGASADQAQHLLEQAGSIARLRMWDGGIRGAGGDA